MEEHVRKRIEEIIGQMQCAKDFTCAESGFENLCKAKDLGLETFLECMEDDPLHCLFSMSFAHGYFCACPLRVYIAKKLKK